MEKLREQDSIRPAADVVHGHYLLVEEDTLPTWLSKGYRMTHSGVVAGARQRLVMVKEPGREQRMAYDSIPNLGASTSAVADAGTIRVGYMQGTLATEDCQKIRGEPYVNAFQYNFFFQNAATSYTAATVMNFVSADHSAAVSYRAGSIVGIWGRMNATISSGSFHIRPRYGATAVSTLRIVLNGSNQAAVDTDAKDVNPVPASTLLRAMLGTGGTGGSAGSPNATGIDIVCGIIYET